MKTREEILAIIQPLYAATPMHSIGVDFIVDFLLLRPSVALDCIRDSNFFGGIPFRTISESDIVMFESVKDALSDLQDVASRYEEDYVTFSEWYRKNIKS